jgi:Domain of unknown function (DUF4396)
MTALAIASLSIAGLCAAWIVVDVVRRPLDMAVMNWVWPITALYFGPLALIFYRRYGRGMEHPRWVSVAVDASHCGAGCTLGDIISETVIFFTGWQIAGSMLFAEFVSDYVAAYVLGIAFQYFAIAPMRGLSFWPGVWAAVKADTLSLTAFEIGLFGWMAFTSLVLFHPALQANRPEFWFMMQVGMICGFITALPVNWWLLKVGIKEPM